ncbi:MAG: tetratricopeptide repeat protein, partial [Candidatus Cloacimonetes bacterium]|nr:tetratricopeptide repeat protein [Candidatus Cloacimonadota bacterium]
AIEDFKLAIALDPLFSPAYMNLGILALNSKDYPAAIRYFSDIARLEPDNLDALNNLGIAYIALKQKDKAFDTWQAILKQKPDYELARKNLEHYQ